MNCQDTILFFLKIVLIIDRQIAPVFSGVPPAVCNICPQRFLVPFIPSIGFFYCFNKLIYFCGIGRILKKISFSASHRAKQTPCPGVPLLICLVDQQFVNIYIQPYFRRTPIQYRILRMLTFLLFSNIFVIILASCRTFI